MRAHSVGVDVSDCIDIEVIAYINIKSPSSTMSDHHLVTLALDTVDAIMSPPKQPKVLLFDIGGVCVSCSLASIHGA